MKSGLKKRLAAAALCVAAISATGAARDGFHPPRGISQACRQLFQKKRQDAPQIYSLHGPHVECIGTALFWPRNAPGTPFEFNGQALS